MSRSIIREKVYVNAWGYDILIDMGASIVGATAYSFFITDTDGVTAEITTGISIVDFNWFGIGY